MAREAASVRKRIRIRTARDLTQVDERSLASAIAQRLEADILRGALRPGDRLDERELSAAHGVSRTPVREALQRLAAGGIAVARGRQGLRVAQLTVEDFLDGLTVAASLEALAASQAARRIRPDQAESLSRAEADGAAAAERDDVPAFLEADGRFHDAIAAASQNALLQDEIRRVHLRIGAYRRVTAFRPGRLPRSAQDHAELADAIRRGLAAEAAAVMQRHVSLPDERVADFLQFLRGSQDRVLFAPSE
ncbi:MAG: GntR family transcriptional regulator [Methylobacteriaceae bacterium]|nr:GntR family transcriptional regulator [Methylobacteriaceae bacterium]